MFSFQSPPLFLISPIKDKKPKSPLFKDKEIFCMALSSLLVSSLGLSWSLHVVLPPFVGICGHQSTWQSLQVLRPSFSYLGTAFTSFFEHFTPKFGWEVFVKFLYVIESYFLFYHYPNHLDPCLTEGYIFPNFGLFSTCLFSQKE